MEVVFFFCILFVVSCDFFEEFYFLVGILIFFLVGVLEVLFEWMEIIVGLVILISLKIVNRIN